MSVLIRNNLHMDDKTLKEIKEIRLLLSKIIGTSDLPIKERFSNNALDEAANHFRVLSIKRKEWISGSEISAIIRNAPYNAGRFIIEHFDFKDYFKRGKSLYFNRKSILALNRELKARNVDLKRYMEYIDDKAKFDKYISLVKISKGKKRGTHFSIPEGLENIFTSPPPAPAIELVKDHLSRLRNEYAENKYSNYIDVYENNYAMIKFEYLWNHYMNSEIKRNIKKWCQEFNYANEAIRSLTD